MTATDFSFEFHSEILNLAPALRTEAEDHLQELATDHEDIIGASVAVEELTGATTPYRYQARVVVYMRPSDVAVVEKGETAEVALKGALDTVERQIRQYRAKLRESWKQP